ncbi:MAG: hypothetical protein HDR05_08515 [Lachnospiraceae bacterium]|nr:hypothetical protein [Lachnospiraceae bacterium]
MAREMKDSGVEWIGEIPKEWNIAPLKRFAKIQTGNTPSKTDETLFYADEGTLWIKPDNLGTGFSITHTAEYLTTEGCKVARVMPPNTVYVCCIGSLGKVGYSLVECCCNQQINALVYNERMYWKFGYYLTLAQESRYLLYGNGNVLQIINATNQGNIECIVPSISEQKNISMFLDGMSVELNNILEKTCASIEEYKKLKQAVITQAVTKGIRGDREMKSSDIEWIGEIPAEWEERRIKTLFTLRDEKNYSPLEEVNLISLYTDLGVVQHSELEKTTGNKASNADGYKIVYKDDIVVNIILCWMGAIGHSEYNGVTSPAYDIYVPKNEVLSKFYHYYFRTKGFSGDCYKRGKGIMAMRWRTYSDQFRDIKVVHPSLEEQQEIVNYLDQKCSAIDELIAKKEQYLSEIENYKKSLIYEYVTGKREVPQGYQA